MFRDVIFNLFSCNKVHKPGKHVYDLRVSKLGCNSCSESIENFITLINCELTLNRNTKSSTCIYTLYERVKVEENHITNTDYN